MNFLSEGRYPHNCNKKDPLVLPLFHSRTGSRGSPKDFEDRAIPPPPFLSLRREESAPLSGGPKAIASKIVHYPKVNKLRPPSSNLRRSELAGWRTRSIFLRETNHNFRLESQEFLPVLKLRGYVVEIKFSSAYSVYLISALSNILSIGLEI